MKFRHRITVVFTLLVSAILLLICGSVYYFSALNRQNEFRKRIRNRALTTADLLINENIDTNLLRKIDHGTLIALQDKSVRVYNYSHNVIYSYNDNNTQPVQPDSGVLEEVKTGNTIFFKDRNRDALAINYTRGNNNYIVVAAAFDEDGYIKLYQLRLILGLSFAASVLIVIVAGWLFSSRLVIPIKNITDEVTDISSRNLSRRIKVPAPKDELHTLAETFNDLLLRLQQSFELQRRFISNASHELSTPLTSISSQLEITLQNPRDSGEYQRVIKSVYDDVKDLSRLTKVLLDIAKASGSEGGIDITLVRLDELVIKTPGDISKANPQYVVKTFFDSFPEDEDDMFVFGNADLLYSAIKNIVSNACKYSYDHTAHVSLNFAGDILNVIVSDNGPGIKEDEIDLIFQPFFRSANAPETGFGLGLSLASNIIKLHKGTIKVDTAPGKGSKFTVTLPVAKTYYSL